MDDNNNKPQPQVPPQPQFQQAPQQPQFQQVQQPQPQQQQFPQQPVMGTPYQMPPKKKMSKGVMWGIVGGIIGLVVIIVGVVLAVLLLSGPSKADYKAAVDKVNDTIEIYNKASTSLSYVSTSETKTSLESTRKKLASTKEEVNNQLTEIGKMKAVTGDKEVREKYDALKNKLGKFNDAIDAFDEVYGKILPAVADFSDSSNSSNISTLESAVKKARQDLKGADIKNEHNKKFVKDFTAQLEKLEEMLPKVAEMKSDYKKYDSNYISDFYDTLTAIQKTAREWSSGLQKIAEEGEIKDELNNLGAILVNKVNK